MLEAVEAGSDGIEDHTKLRMHLCFLILLEDLQERPLDSESLVCSELGL